MLQEYLMVLESATEGWLSSKRTQMTNDHEDVEQKESLYTVCGNVNWYHSCGKQYGSFSKNWK